MKKTLITIFLSLLTVLTLTNTVFADDTYYQGDFEYKIENNGITIIGYYGDETYVQIPYNIGTYLVKKIDTNAFDNTPVNTISEPFESDISYDGIVTVGDPYDLSDYNNSNDVVIYNEPRPLLLTYTGQQQPLLEPGDVHGGNYYYQLDNSSFSKNVPLAKNAGTYRVKYYVKGNENFNDTALKQTSVTIQKADLNVLYRDQIYVYNNKEQGEPIKATGVDDKEVTILYSTVNDESYPLNSAPTRKEIGTTSVYFKAQLDNHNTVTGEYKIIVKEADVEVVYPTSKYLTYNGQSQELINPGTLSNGHFLYKVGSGSYSTSLPTAKDAATYTVYYKSDNNTIPETKISVKIEPAKIIVEADNQLYKDSSTAQGKPIHVKTFDDSEAIIKYSLDGVTYNIDDAPTFIDNGEHLVYYKVTAKNHKEVTGSYLVTIDDGIKPEITKGDNGEIYEKVEIDVSEDMNEKDYSLDNRVLLLSLLAILVASILGVVVGIIVINNKKNK